MWTLPADVVLSLLKLIQQDSLSVLCSNIHFKLLLSPTGIASVMCRECIFTLPSAIQDEVFCLCTFEPLPDLQAEIFCFLTSRCESSEPEGMTSSANSVRKVSIRL